MNSEDTIEEEVLKQYISIQRMLKSNDGKRFIKWLNDNYILSSSVNEHPHIMDYLVGQKELAQEICALKDINLEDETGETTDE